MANQKTNLKFSAMPSKRILDRFRLTQGFLASVPKAGGKLFIVSWPIRKGENRAKVLYMVGDSLHVVTDEVAALVGMPMAGTWDNQGLRFNGDQIKLGFILTGAMREWGKQVTVSTLH